LKIKLKGSHFDVTEAIEAASMAVMDTFMDYGFQNAYPFCIHAGRNYFEGDGGQ
jgi:hypothetical protein